MTNHVLLFAGSRAYKMTGRMDVGQCSQPTLTDRPVFKITFYHEPMMREEPTSQLMMQEEQVNNFVLHQVLYKKDDGEAAALNNNPEDEELHLTVEEDPRGVTQQYHEANLYPAVQLHSFVVFITLLHICLLYM